MLDHALKESFSSISISSPVSRSVLSAPSFPVHETQFQHTLAPQSSPMVSRSMAAFSAQVSVSSPLDTSHYAISEASISMLSMSRESLDV